MLKKQSTKGSKKKAKESLEIEKPEVKPPSKMKNDRNKHRDEFKAPLLDESNAD